MDYSIYFREELPVDSDWSGLIEADIFISAFNSSERVTESFLKVDASEKVWLALPEYNYDIAEIPSTGERYICDGGSEAEQIVALFDHYKWDLLGRKLAIDATGFMRPQLGFLMRFLSENGVSEFEIVYSEPDQYVKKERTEFYQGNIQEVRQIAGLGGVHNTDTSNDLLIVGAGYDADLINAVAQHKDNATVHQVIGFPSLRPDMYQESILQCVGTENAIGSHALRNPHFAPANDPFVTASVLGQIIEKANSQSPVTNVYLAPLSTKSQSVGFFLYYIQECLGKNVSVLYPFHESYDRETSKGLKKAWRYKI